MTVNIVWLFCIPGKSYETLIQDMFDLLGMEDSTFTQYLDPAKQDVATPHVGVDGVCTPVSLNVHRSVYCNGPV